MNHSLITFLCWIFIASVAQAQDSKSENIKQRVESNWNDLYVIQLDEGALGNAFSIRLNNQEVIKTGGEEDQSDFRYHEYPLPDVILHVTSEVYPFQEVFVLQQRMWGNACDGGRSGF